MAKPYKVLEIEDLSVGIVRRFNARVIYPNLTLTELKKEIHNIAKEVKVEKIYRNQTIKRKWKNVPAQIVWFEIYKSKEKYNKEEMTTHVLWADSTLRRDLVPVFISTAEEFIKKLQGTEIDETFLIDWRE